mgnify:FL=1
MANSQSALKRVRQNEKRRVTNQKVRSVVRTYTNKFEKAAETGEKAAAEEAYRAVVSILDRAAGKGVIPKERASRKKGRMAARLAKLG